MIEPDDFARYERHVKSLLSKVDDPESFAMVVGLHDEMRQGLDRAATRLRDTDGYSWANLARALGVTRSAVYQRFGRHRATPS